MKIRNEKEDRDNIYEIIKSENETLKEELEKLKKYNKDHLRKDAATKEFRDKLEVIKNQEKNNQDEIKSLQEKNK